MCLRRDSVIFVFQADYLAFLQIRQNVEKVDEAKVTCRRPGIFN